MHAVIARSVLLLIVCLATFTAACGAGSSSDAPYSHNEITNLLTLDVAVAMTEGTLRIPSSIECVRVATTLQERLDCAKAVWIDLATSSAKQSDIIGRAEALSSGDCLTALQSLKKKSDGAIEIVTKFQQIDASQVTQAELERFIKMADVSGSLNPEMDTAIEMCSTTS